MQARDDRITQKNIEPEHYYVIDASEHTDDTLDTDILWNTMRHSLNTEMAGLFVLDIRENNKPVP